MGYFADSTEVDKYIGGVFRAANDHEESGPKLRSADVFLKVFYTDPDTEMNIFMKEPAIEVSSGPVDEKPDVTLLMAADTGDKFWRGEPNGLYLIKIHCFHFWSIYHLNVLPFPL